MKILILNYEYPPVGSGAGVISENIAEGLVNLGNNVSVVSVFFEGLSFHQTGKPEIFRVKSRRKNLYRSGPAEMLSWAKKTIEFLDQHLKDTLYDICIANFTIPGGIVARYLKKKYGLPYVVISHGHDIPWVKPFSMYGYFLLTYFKIKKIIKNAEYLFVQTEEMKINAEKFAGKTLTDKIHIIPNGCDSKLFSPADYKKPEKLNILFAGRLVRQKNPIMFLKAIRLLKEKSDIPFNAKIYGDGPLRRKTEKFIRKNKLEDVVSLSGKIPPDQMPEKYRFSDLFVSTSVSEGMSIAVLEAAFSGLFVIATPASGNRQIMQDYKYGKIIPYNDETILLNEIITIYKYDYSASGHFPYESHKNFIQKYSWGRISGLYQQVLEGIFSH